MVVNEGKAIEAYRKFLDIAPSAPQRSEAMRRIGDLEMQNADTKSADNAASGGLRLQGGDRPLPGLPEELPEGPEQRPGALPDVGRLREGRRPRDLAEDARPAGPRLSEDALHQRGAVPPRRAALHDEGLRRARRRRIQDRPRRPPEASPFQDRVALHDGLVAVYKQGRLDDGAASSFLGGARPQGRGPRRRRRRSTPIQGLSARPDHELVEDTFRVASISIANLQGDRSRSRRSWTRRRARAYEFRVYEQLGRALHQAGAQQGRGRCVQCDVRPKRNPLAAQAPAMQARVIEIYDKHRLHQPGHRGTQGIRRALRPPERVPPRQPGRLGQGATSREDPPRASSQRHYHATGAEDKAERPTHQEAVRWYREFLASFPNDRGRSAEPTSCLRSCCSMTAASPRPASSTRKPRTATPSTTRAPKPATARCSASQGNC